MAAVQALILAAGKGTRMKSGKTKVLHTALGLPLLEHVLRAVDAVAPGPTTVVIGHQADAVRVAFSGRDLTFVVQEPQRGTGHAVQIAREHIAQHAGRTLLVLIGDMPLLRGETLRSLLDAHRMAGAAATLLTGIFEDPGAYGRVLRDARRVVRGIVEARDASAEEKAIREINSGVYAFEVPPLLSVLDRLEPQNAQGEYYLTDVVGLLVAAGQRVEAVPVEDPTEVLGVNTLAELADASRRIRLRRLAELMEAGVVVEDPVSTAVGLDVVVEPDAILRPHTLLEGKTVVKAEAQVGPYVRLVDTEVGVGAQILDHCLLRECVVGAGAAVGPFAHVRPETRIGTKARVGNFVELKKTRLGDGSKAPHLSYLGDASIGPGTNIGAGTITCNYDGTHKYPTQIGSGVFVGSNSTLVAPVTIGDGAYVGAGSVVTEDVPVDALALGRARQIVKPGWAQKRREKQRTDQDAAAAKK